MSFPAKPPIERFLPKIEITETCWLWTRHVSTKGYAYFSHRSCRSMLAHRWSYQWFVGPIPEGLTIDHLCRVRHCVNPDHLEAVPERENFRRGLNGELKHLRPRKTHCPQGHEYSPDNIYINPKRGRQECRICRRFAVQSFRQRRRQHASS